jgi:hypothetical protein
VAVLLAVFPLADLGCSLDFVTCTDPDPSVQHARSCDGNVFVDNHYRSGGSGVRCQQGTTRVDCSAQNLICVVAGEEYATDSEPTCAAPCTTDAESLPTEHCAPPGDLWQPAGGQSACKYGRRTETRVRDVGPRPIPGAKPAGSL